MFLLHRQKGIFLHDEEGRAIVINNFPEFIEQNIPWIQKNVPAWMEKNRPELIYTPENWQSIESENLSWLISHHPEHVVDQYPDEVESACPGWIAKFRQDLLAPDSEEILKQYLPDRYVSAVISYKAQINLKK